MNDYRASFLVLVYPQQLLLSQLALRVNSKRHKWVHLKHLCASDDFTSSAKCFPLLWPCECINSGIFLLTLGFVCVSPWLELPKRRGHHHQCVNCDWVEINGKPAVEKTETVQGTQQHRNRDLLIIVNKENVPCSMGVLHKVFTA
jgi:hypothetical protein